MINQTLNNRYKIISQLGEGGMGEVYLAVDEKNNQQVAVKILARQLSASPEALERFKREGETLRQLDHPNIVKFMDAFEHEKQYIIVMEYVSGGSLQNLIKQGQLPIERVRQITLDLCDALIRAHRLNIIHRDLKPENVLITENEIPKLADFGVARLSESTSMTRSGTQVGTPYYMAPEAWEGKTLDAQADIWSLGVMLFEMVAGKVPFGGETGAAVMNKVLTTQPPDLRKLRADVPSNLTKIIRRMLTRDKKNRYPTMREVAVDLERGQRTTANIPIKPKWYRLRPALIGLGVVLALSFVWLGSRNQSEQTNSPVITLTNTPRPTATIIRTPAPTSTPNPLEFGEWLEQCGSDLCIVDYSGKMMPIGLVGIYTNFNGFSLSPDASQIAFGACLSEEIARNPNAKCYHAIFVVNRDGSDPVTLRSTSGTVHGSPSWSPDGEWIAYGEWNFEIIHPDGSGLQRIISDTSIGNVYDSAWSPDSRQIAFIAGECPDGNCFRDQVFIINSDGTDWRPLFISPAAASDPFVRIAISPDGKTVSVESESGIVYLIDINCESGPAGCDESFRTEINEIPQDWLDTFYPQWLSAYVDPEAAVSGCGFSEKLLFAEDFENSVTNNQLGLLMKVAEAPGGGNALHMVNVADGQIDYILLDHPVIESRISFRVMPINGVWALRFRIGELDGKDASNLLVVSPGDTGIRLTLDMDPSYATLGTGPRLINTEWSTIEMSREDSDTIVVWLNNEEIIRYADSRNLLVPSGGINVNVVGKDAEAWYDDFVICGQE